MLVEVEVPGFKQTHPEAEMEHSLLEAQEGEMVVLVNLVLEQTPVPILVQVVVVLGLELAATAVLA
jgi:hypothetical protein